MSEKAELKKLNIGCGGMALPGFYNLDVMDHSHVHIPYDLESGRAMKWGALDGVPDGMWSLEVPDNYFDRMLMSHVFEHITNVLPMMEELWRVAKPGCSLVIITPYGSHDSADEDPTHVRRVFKDSFSYFSQGYYGKNDYGYRGDWDFRRRQFTLDGNFFAEDTAPEQVGMAVANLRNVVTEFLGELVAVKPARKPGFQVTDPTTTFKFTKPIDVPSLLVPGGRVLS